jgi:hypothetical protein
VGMLITQQQYERNAGPTFCVVVPCNDRPTPSAGGFTV